MKRVSLLLPVAGVLACMAMEAQTTVLTANIPFRFQIGKDEMPAGKYRIDYTTRVLTVSCPAERKAVMVLTTPSSRDKTPETGLLLFHRYGDTYFLSGVWKPGSSDGAGIVRSSREKELARRMGTPRPATVALNTKR